MRLSLSSFRGSGARVSCARPQPPHRDHDATIHQKSHLAFLLLFLGGPFLLGAGLPKESLAEGHASIRISPDGLV